MRVEGPLACAPLSLLGWHSWARGEGALARVAVERALAEDPTYRLAGLLLRVLDNAIAPDWVSEARRADDAGRLIRASRPMRLPGSTRDTSGYACGQVMSASVKPRLAGRQPSSAVGCPG